MKRQAITLFLAALGILAASIGAAPVANIYEDTEGPDFSLRDLPADAQELVISKLENPVDQVSLGSTSKEMREKVGVVPGGSTCSPFKDKYQIRRQVGRSTREVVFVPFAFRDIVVDLSNVEKTNHQQIEEMMSTMNQLHDCIVGMMNEGHTVKGLDGENMEAFKIASDTVFKGKHKLAKPFHMFAELLIDSPDPTDLTLAYAILRASSRSTLQRLLQRFMPSPDGYVFETPYDGDMPSYKVEGEENLQQISKKYFKAASAAMGDVSDTPVTKLCAYRQDIGALAIEAGNQYVLASLLEARSPRDICQCKLAYRSIGSVALGNFFTDDSRRIPDNVNQWFNEQGCE